MRERDDVVTALLVRARARIADPARWTQGAYARDAEGRQALPKSQDAVRWCALGALEAELPYRVVDRILDIPLDLRYLDAVQRLEESILAEDWATPANVPGLNDGAGHEAVLAAYDEAIRRK